MVSKLLRKTKNRIKLIWQGIPCLLERITHPRAAYLVFTPEHGNLGDHAIAQAEKRFLEQWRIPVIEVTGKELNRRNEKGLLRFMNGRPILIHGGGFLGTIWPAAESMVRVIIRANKKSSIIFLPNTVFFEESDEGNKELKRSQEIYNAHQSLTLYCREKKSYEFARQRFNHTKLIPDMAMSLNFCQQNSERAGCILCLRADRERTRSEADDNVLQQQARAIWGADITFLDMNTGYDIPVCNRDKELQKQYDAFRHAELVITDRLHGMVFCAITGTPCIVIDSKSPKVRGCYEWIKDIPYIRFCDDVKDIGNIYQSIPKQDWQYDQAKLLPLYEPLKYDILCAVRGKRYADHFCNRSRI